MMPATTLTPTRIDAPDLRGGGPPARDDGREWRGDGRPRVPARTYHLAMWLALGAVVMFFAALTSAIVVRQGLGGDWVSIPLPRALFLNTLVLVASSVTLELARRALREGRGARFAALLYATTALGLVFVAGQYLAWSELAAAGLYLASNPASSFFYVLTAAHGAHLLGGIGALAYVSTRARRLAAREMRPTALDVTALYWHFMDGLWVYILLLLLVRF